MVGVGMGLLLRHDEEVDGILMKNAVLILGIRGYAQMHVPKGLSHHRVPRVSQGWLLRHEELFDFLGSAVDSFGKGHHRGPHSATGSHNDGGENSVISRFV